MSSSRSMDFRLSEAQLSIDNALNTPEILAIISPYGFSVDKLQEGRGIYESALAENKARTASRGSQLGATDRMTQAQRSTYQSYINHIKIARIVFQNDREANAALDLTGRRKRDLPGCIAQMKTFYTNALSNPAFVAALGSYNITQTALSEGQSLVSALEAVNGQQEQAKGKQEDAIAGQSAAFRNMDQWMSKYKRVARVALEATPQYLSALGF